MKIMRFVVPVLMGTAFIIGSSQAQQYNSYYSYSNNYNQYSYSTQGYDDSSYRPRHRYRTWAQMDSDRTYKDGSGSRKGKNTRLAGNYLGTGGKSFIFDPRRHQWFAYHNGSLVASGQASGGRGYCPDIHRGCHTPVGSFSVLRKGSADCKSTRYPIRKNGRRGGAPMGYCMFFTNYYAIHASNDVPANANASHGCIRVLPTAARWLSQNFLNYGTRVVVRPY